MHYRSKKIKREHSIINGLLPLLEKLAEDESIRSIIPGRIKPIVGNYPKVILEFKVNTDSGIKCIAKSGRSVQEVFIVTDEIEKVKENLRINN